MTIEGDAAGNRLSHSRSSVCLFPARRHIADEDPTPFHAAFSSTTIASVGPMGDAFEAEFVAYTGISRAVDVSRGNVAMHLAASFSGARHSGPERLFSVILHKKIG
jgi:dTDP-4-amino-4,6-dideoxygalactose transaminase